MECLILIILLIILACSIYVTCTVYKIKRLNNKELYEDIFNYETLYKKYAYQYWPIQIGESKGMNISYLSGNILGYLSFFDTSKNIILFGKIPDNLDLWNMNIYDSNGNLFQSWTQTSFPSKNYKFSLGLEQKIPQGYYCVCIYFIINKKTPLIFPHYMPQIFIKDINLLHISSETRESNSKLVQNNIYTYFKNFYKKNSSIHSIGSKNNLFVPSNSSIVRVFPIPLYNIQFVFPLKSKVVMIRGSRPIFSPLYHEKFPYVAYSTADLKKGSIDESILLVEMTVDYIIFFAYSSDDAKKNGYDKKNKKHFLLLWNKKNKNPIVLLSHIVVSNEIKFKFHMPDRVFTI